MNREIKFRIWLPSINKFRNFLFVLDLDGTCLEEIGHGETEVNKEAIIQQFTGLLDKNGKEIYEGDIIKTPLSHMFRDNIYVVKYFQNRFIPDDICDEKDIEIIGNIFENPELIK
jgi:hypothetical protein